MAKITVDVVLNDGEDSTTFGDSFSSNDNVDVRNPMVSNPSLIGVNVEESYFDTFKSDSRIKTAQRADEFPVAPTGTPPAFTNMNGKKIVVSSSAWDTNQPGSNFIPAQFYYDTDIIPSPLLSEQTKSFFYALKNNSYFSIQTSNSLGVTQYQNNPTLEVFEGGTLRLYPPSIYNLQKVVGVTPPSTPTTYNITTIAPSSGNYTLSGTDRNGSVSGANQPVTVNVGDTINFNLSSVSSIHPFYLKTALGYGNSNQVNTPVATGQGSTGSNTVSWTPNAAGTYYYQCGNHYGMNGTITVASGGGGYVIDVSDRVSVGDGNQTNPTINIEVGDSVYFYNEVVYSNGSAHPLYIKTAPTTGTGDQVTTGTASGQGGVATAAYSLFTSWDTSTSQGGSPVTPGTYYYQSSASLGVGGKIIVHAAGTLSNEPIYVCTSASNPIGTQVSNSTPNISNVTNQGTTDSNNYLTVTFGEGSTGTYYYQSSNNASYGGTINVTKSSGNSVGVRTGATYLPDVNDAYSNVNYSSQWTGKHVDIVTVEVGVDWVASNFHVSHPDFDSLTSPGTTRFIPQDWPGLVEPANLQVSNGTQILTSHGIGVLSAAGGTICGFAKHANLYQMSSTGSDSWADLYDSILTWHNAKSVNPTTGKKNPTIVIGEVQFGTWWNSCYKISEISSIQENINGIWTDVVTRPSGGWGQVGSDVTAFVDRCMIPRQIKDPDTNEYHWVIPVPDPTEYNALNVAMDACNAAGIHMINASANQGGTFVKNDDSKYGYNGERFIVDANATVYSIGYGTGNSWQITIGKGSVPLGSPEYPWFNYGIHGKPYGIDVAAGQNSEEWSVLDDYSCRGPGIDIVGMGGNTYTSNPNTTFSGGYKWGMFSGTSCATPTVVGKAACEIEKYFTYNNEYPTPTQLKEIVCQRKYFYGHRSDDTYQRKHILLSDSFIRSLTPYAGTANQTGTYNWSSLPVPQTGTNYYSHFYGTVGLCQIYEGQYINGGINFVELAGTTRQKASLNVKGFDRSQTRGPRPLSGGVYPRPKIGRHNQLPFIK